MSCGEEYLYLYYDKKARGKAAVAFFIVHHFLLTFQASTCILVVLFSFLCCLRTSFFAFAFHKVATFNKTIRIGLGFYMLQVHSSSSFAKERDSLT